MNIFHKFLPFSAKIEDQSLIISKNKSFKINSENIIVFFNNILALSSIIGSVIGMIIGFHIEAKSAAIDTHGDEITILLGGIQGSFMGGVFGLLSPISVPLYLIINGYKKYSRC